MDITILDKTASANDDHLNINEESKASHNKGHEDIVEQGDQDRYSPAPNVVLNVPEVPVILQTKHPDGHEDITDKAIQERRSPIQTDLLNVPQVFKVNQNNEQGGIMESGVEGSLSSAQTDVCSRDHDEIGLQIVAMTSISDSDNSMALGSNSSSTYQSGAQQSDRQHVSSTEVEAIELINIKEPCNEKVLTKQVEETSNANIESNHPEPMLNEPMIGQDAVHSIIDTSDNVTNSSDCEIDSSYDRTSQTDNNTTSANKDSFSTPSNTIDDNEIVLTENRIASTPIISEINHNISTVDNKTDSLDVEMISPDKEINKIANITSMAASSGPDGQLDKTGVTFDETHIDNTQTDNKDDSAVTLPKVNNEEQSSLMIVCEETDNNSDLNKCTSKENQLTGSAKEGSLDDTTGSFSIPGITEPTFCKENDISDNHRQNEDGHSKRIFNHSLHDDVSKTTPMISDDKPNENKSNYCNEKLLTVKDSVSFASSVLNSNEERRYMASDGNTRCMIKNGEVKMIKNKEENPYRTTENISISRDNGESIPDQKGRNRDNINASGQLESCNEPKNNIHPFNADENKSSDSDLGFSIVSVRGNVGNEETYSNQNTNVPQHCNKEVGKTAAVQSKLPSHIDKTAAVQSKLPTHIVKTAAVQSKLPTHIGKTAAVQSKLPTHIYQSDQQTGNQNKKTAETNITGTMDTTEPLMIMDVRSLSEPNVSDTDDMLPNSSSYRPGTAANATDETLNTSSQSIEALRDMCSSVNMIASGGMSKHQDGRLDSTTENNVTTPQTNVNRVSGPIEGSSDVSLPFTSNSFTVKSEPLDQGYNAAEGSVSSQNASKHSAQKSLLSSSPIAPKPQVCIPSTGSVVQLVVSHPGSKCKIAPGISMRTTVQNPVVVQVVQSTTAKPSFPKPSYEKGSNQRLSKKNAGVTSIPGRTMNENSSSMAVQIPDVFDSVEIQPMNIRNVGVSKITELIARKNPIPPYKPPPIPDTLKSKITSNQQHPCYECGDSFLFEKSLRMHLSRRSIKIRYYCEKCSVRITFTNKCQMLNHLRGHLNIEKTQAVPIHIKSDSIEIATYYEEIANSNYFKFLNDFPGDIEAEERTRKSHFQCPFCPFMCSTVSERLEHFEKKSGALFYCNLCPLYMDNQCGLMAHKLIHEINRNSKFNKLLCPECGEDFSKVPGTAQFFFHIKHKCLHLSRFSYFKCLKCDYFCSSVKSIEHHLLYKLEMYYKCQHCPMALRTISNYNTHVKNLHSTLEVKKIKPSLLYRCHHCGTLINDKDFLKTHIAHHVTDIKNTTRTIFRCIQCTRVFQKRDQLMAHYSVAHKSLPSKFGFCNFCCKDIGEAYNFVLHVLSSHTDASAPVQMFFCEECGEVCDGTDGLKSHRCIMASNTLGTAVTKVPTGNGISENQSGTTDTPKIPGLRMILPKQTTSDKKTLNNVDKMVPVKFPFPKKSGARKPQNKNKPIPVANPLPPNLQLSESVSPVCKICGENFHGKIHRINHLRKHRDNDIFICITCDETGFKTYHDLRSHEILCTSMEAQKNKEKETKPKAQTARKHTTPKIKIRRQAKEEFSVELVPDTRTFADPLPADVEKKCDQCEAVFTRKSKLDEHKKKEHGLHPCHLCGLMHDSQSALKKHLILSHEGKKLRYYCLICKGKKIDKHFSEKSNLEKHMRHRHRKKQWDDFMIEPQIPGLHGKSVSPEPEKRKLDYHSDKQSEEKPAKKVKTNNDCDYKCAKCLFTSMLRDDFVKHVKEHKDSLTVQCLECGLCFSVLPSLRKHLFIVHKVRDFDKYCIDNDIREPEEMVSEAIPDIGPEESDRESSEEEIEVDTVNPLECQVCYKTFENEAALKGHIRTHGMALIKKLRKKPKKGTKLDSQEGELALHEGKDKIQDEGDVDEPMEKE